MAIGGSIDGERRRAELARLAREDGVSIAGAAKLFEVSAMTIRRDLEVLEGDGLVRRVRGGAVAAAAPQSYDDRSGTRIGAKRAIAQKALQLMPGGGAVSFDASTTVNALAAMVGGRDGLTVCTNSIETFETLEPLAGVSGLLTGGAHAPVTGSLVGPLANAGARALRAEVFFTSAAGLDARIGTTEATLEEAEVKRNFAALAERVVLCVDTSKLGQRSLGAALTLAEVSTLITELDPDDARLDPYRDRVTVL